MAKKQQQKQKATAERNPPGDPIYLDMLVVRVGALAPGTPFWNHPGSQLLSGVVIYHSVTSSNVKARLERPITHEEYTDDIAISTGSMVLVRIDDYEKQKHKPIPSGEVRGAPGMEGFPEF